MDAPTHIHGWHRNSRRSRDQRRTRRELRVCPAVTRRHLDRFIWLYEDTVWVDEAEIEREIASDKDTDEHSTHDEQPTSQDESLATERREAATREKAIMDAFASTSTSAGAGPTTQPKSIISADTDMSGHLARDQRQTAHDEIMAIMMKRLDIKTHEAGTTHSTPSTNTDTTPLTSTSAGASTTTQPAPEPTGESVQTEYSPQLMSLLDWFLSNKEKIGNTDVPGGSSGVASRHGNAEY